jgi:hypothetical protein
LPDPRFEVVPGVSIGPVRLGMTREEIRALPILRLSETEDGAGFDLVARERGPYDIGADAIVRFDEKGRCKHISVTVDGACELYLGDESLRSPGSELEGVLQRLGPIQHGYGSATVPARGVDATKWENGDSFYYMVGVFPPKAP